MRLARFLVLVTLLLAAAAVAAQQAWKPDKAVEIVSGAGAGGSQDTTARVIQKIIQDKHLVDVTTAVANKSGGGGAIGWVYLNQHAGDGHYFEIGTTSLLTNHILGRDSVSYTDLTPIALLFSEHVAYAVRADSALKSGRDLVEQLKRAPGSVSIAVGTTLGNANHISLAKVMRAAGISRDARDLKLVVFKSGGEAMTALLGGHVDVLILTPTSIVPYVKSGTLRVIAIAASRRSAGALAPVPTWKEQGYDVVIDSWRAVFGPRGLNPPQVAFWENVFARIAQSSEWQNELDENYWDNNFRRSADTRKYLETEYQDFKSLLTEVGLAK